MTTGVGLSSPQAVLTQQFNEVLSYLEVSTVELRVQEYMDPSSTDAPLWSSYLNEKYLFGDIPACDVSWKIASRLS